MAMTTPIFTPKEKEMLISGVFEAAEILMRYFKKSFHIELKADTSPVTEADKAAHTFLVGLLKRLTPTTPIISEEDDEHPSLGDATRFWLVDPLDGTQSFIDRNEEFCINVALVVEGSPMVGVICHPPRKSLYATFGDGIIWRYTASEGVTHGMKGTIVPKPASEQIPNIAVMSRSRKQQALINEFLPMDAMPRMFLTSGLKFCSLLEGKASHYPSACGNMEWDIAAGDALLRAHGGYIACLDGTKMTYGKKDWVNSHFIAYRFGTA